MATISEALAIAIQHHQAGRLQAAEQIYRQILQVEPNHPDAIHLLGMIAYQAGKHAAAVEYIRRAIGLRGTSATFHNNLGNVLMDQGKRDEAVACYRRALELKPDYAAAHSNLGNAFWDQGKLDEAVACYRRALDLKPDYAEAYNNLGAALKDQGKLDEAVTCYRRALELKSGYADAHNNLGVALVSQGKLNEAVACYSRVLELDPERAEARLNRSFLWLLTGDFEHGWPEYEWRWRTKQISPRPFQQPLWDGSSLAGKTILLHAEQGLGDAIQFVRYAPLVKQLGGTIIVECQQPMLPLLATCPGIDRLVGQGGELPAFTTHAPLLSVPGILKTSLDTIPASVPYLFAARALVESWREKLRGVSGFKIGINWQGRAGQGSWLARNIPLQQFAALAAIPGVRLISLQKGSGREELTQERERFPVLDPGNEVDQESGAFMDTAAIMMNLDLVITSDTAIPHLAGALGVPVWLALPFAPDWRWLLDRTDSPWYPTMRLFRQQERDNWHGVFEQIEKALRQQLESACR